METKTEYVHFRIGADAGKLLMQIAQEHLIYNYSPEKCLATIEESLTGCPRNLALSLIKGDHVLLVNEDEQCFEVEEYNKDDHSDYPILNIPYWCENIYSKMLKASNSIEDGFDEISRSINKNVKIEIDWKQIIKLISENKQEFYDELEDEIRCDSDVIELEHLIYVTKEFLEKIYKISNTIKVLKNWYPDEIEEEYNFADIIADIHFKLNILLSGNFDGLKKDDVKIFIENELIINDTISNGIKPVNILDNYSAGWLSPNGTYYGLNGDIANNLHNKIADALLEEGIIPSIENYCNADSYLSMNGWVKIHDSHITFEGCLNTRLSKHNVNLTEIQISEIVKYINTCHNGIMKCGWRMTQISAARFQMMSDNLPLLYKTYFEY